MTRWLLFLLLCGFLYTNAQKDVVYYAPKFPGGGGEFWKYISKYTKYPTDELAVDGEGECLATIYIAKNGAVKYVRVTGENQTFNRELKRVLMLMPDWEPGRAGERLVDTMVTQKVLFSRHQARAKNDSTVFEILSYNVPVKDQERRDYYTGLAKRDLERLATTSEYDKGVAAARDSSFAEALEHFNKAQQKGNDSNDLIFNKGIVFYKLGIPDSACKYWLEGARRGDRDAERTYYNYCRKK